MEKKQGFGRYAVCVFLLVAIFAVYGLRLIQWQVVDGKSFYNTANTTSTSFIKLPGARGEILDCHGNPLAQNKTAYNVVFDSTAMPENTINGTILKLIGIMQKMGEKWIDALPITLDSSGNYVFKKDSDSEIRYLKSKSFLHMNSYATADECARQLIKMFECEKYSKQDALKIMSVRYNMKKKIFAPDTPYNFAEDITPGAVSVISENSPNLPGVRIDVTTIREYPDGSLAPHIIGKTGPLSPEEYADFKKENKIYSANNVSGYAYNDVIGQSGIEHVFENQLRGKNGKQEIQTNRKGELITSKITQAPKAGNTVYLSLDSRIQKVANLSLAQNVEAARKAGEASSSSRGPNGRDCHTGGAVMMNIKDFSIIAASTYPSYDLNKYTHDVDYYKKLNQDKYTPMFNRAFNGAFTPGSTFKPLVALAALQEGVITPQHTVYCGGTYMYYAPSYTPHCMGYHGNINVRHALEHSCNIFFYDTGRLLGIERMDNYAALFGLGQKTGVEVSENPGIMSSPKEYKKNHHTDWISSLTIQAAIGQSDDSFTPLQLATFCSTIANQGIRQKAHLSDKITDYTRKDVLKTFPPVQMANTGVSAKNLKVVQEGMRLVCESQGAARRVFSNYGIAVAGKTGTAENLGGHSDNTIFIGYAPYDKPEVAVAVVLEYGQRGTYSMGVAKDMLDAYFYGKYVDKDGHMKMPSAGDKTKQAAKR